MTATDDRRPRGTLVAMTSMALSLLALPELAMIGSPVHASPLLTFACAALAAGCFAATALFVRAPRRNLAIVLIVVIVAFGLSQSANVGASLLLAPPAGIATALLWRPRVSLSSIGFFLISITTLTGARFAIGREVASAAAFLLCLASLGLSQKEPAREVPGLAMGTFAGAGGLLLALASITVIGATTPRAAWFGPLSSHGSRHAPMVAITFDDGPDPPFTLQVMAVLDRYGIKGTFFSVGKAVDQAPEVSRALLADGQLLGNHSYNHNGLGYLDPRYPELSRTESAIFRATGVCPALYRPPHGTHTPFIQWQVYRAGMKLITWDVSAGDWATNDPALVAKRILDGVQPGSIILLHDGLDGQIGADRSVVVQALPQIIEGLQKRGLQPVTLDKLLNVRPYLSSC